MTGPTFDPGRLAYSTRWARLADLTAEQQETARRFWVSSPHAYPAVWDQATQTYLVVEPEGKIMETNEPNETNIERVEGDVNVEQDPKGPGPGQEQEGQEGQQDGDSEGSE